MPAQIYTAFASQAKVNEETIDGLQAIEYRQIKNRHDVGAIGTEERIGVYFGLKFVVGSITIASANKTLDGFLTANTSFTLAVTLKHGDASRNVTFDGCYLDEKKFNLARESHGETIYSFTATRVREE
ncbi:MAG: hypothetical protein QOH12_2701 [Solirubrobacteraceae bacterium]|jgi:hypothetical protein|nr:hypothetical protein [Solirubrobacteraceae bacterium]